MKKQYKEQKDFIKKIFIIYKWRLISLLAIIIISTIVSSVSPYIYGEIIDSITGQNINKLKKNLMIFFVVIIMVELLSIVEGIIGQSAENLLENDIKQILFNKILSTRYSGIEQYMEGELLNRLEFDAEVIVDYYIELITNSVLIIFNFVISFLFIVKISYTLTIISLFLLPVSYLVNFVFRKKIKLARVKQKECDDNYYSFVNEIMGNISSVKIFSLINSNCIKYQEILKERYNISVENIKLSGVITLIRGGVSSALDIVILAVSAMFIFMGEMTIGSMVAFNTYLQKLFEAIKKILDLNVNRQNVMVSYERIGELLNHPIEMDNSEFSKIEIHDILELEFKNVFFRYTELYVLKEVDFEICKKGLYSIVGKNGSGKSTIFKLIEGLYQCSKGSVVINGENVNKIDIASLRKKISYMAKEPFLLNDTIANNLRLGCLGANMQQMEEACKKVCLHEDIMKLKEQYQTFVGESGYCLSSGQKQKLGMARILLRKSSLVLLDEVTSDLDGQTQQIFHKIVKEMSRKAIVLNISHDKDMVKTSDYIIVLCDGHVASVGKHEELLSSSDVYRGLFKVT